MKPPFCFLGTLLLGEVLQRPQITDGQLSGYLHPNIHDQLPLSTSTAKRKEGMRRQGSTHVASRTPRFWNSSSSFFPRSAIGAGRSWNILNRTPTSLIRSGSAKQQMATACAACVLCGARAGILDSVLRRPGRDPHLRGRCRGFGLDRIQSRDRTAWPTAAVPGGSCQEPPTDEGFLLASWALGPAGGGVPSG